MCTSPFLQSSVRSWSRTRRERKARGPLSTSVLDCLALFDSPDDWLEHRKSHSRSSTHSKTETTEYVLQPDGTITLILTAQALADGSTTPSQRLAKPLPPLLSALGPGSQGKLGLPLENGIQRLEIRLAPGVQGQQQQAEMVVIHPYECSECSLLFQTPEDFLQHQGEHFLGQDKESGEAGVMGGFEEPRGREDVERTDESRLRAVDKRGAAAWAAPQRCELKSHIADPLHKCQVCSKTFTNMTKYLYHRRTHFNRDPAAQPSLASTVLAPRRASLSALTILQRARERREAAQTPEEPNENEDDFLAPLTEEQLQQIEAEGEGGSLGQSGGGEDEGGLAALSSGPSSLLHQAASQHCEAGFLTRRRRDCHRLEQHPELLESGTGDPAGETAQGTPTIMCNEFGETIAIIETPEGGTLALEQALEIYHTALENGLTMDTVTVDGLQLL
ncbi:hypothetical protein CRUP_033226 [Coryphaenoides rupestris]|nr:hypothetical protein CRUP_033226 [Coryphaenoides rupestris]